MATWFDRHNRYSDWEAWLELNPEVREQPSRFSVKVTKRASRAHRGE